MNLAIDASRRVSFVCGLALALAAATPEVVRAQVGLGAESVRQTDPSAWQRAASLTSEAHAHYRQGRYERAASLYQRAYRVVPAPELLFDLAQCQRQLDQTEDAIELFQRYLRARPEAPERSRIEHWVATEQEYLALQVQSSPVAAAGPRRAVAAREGAAPTAPEALGSAHRTDATGVTESDVASDDPIYARWWFWVVGVGVVAAATAVTLVAMDQGNAADPMPGTLGTVRW